MKWFNKVITCHKCGKEIPNATRDISAPTCNDCIKSMTNEWKNSTSNYKHTKFIIELDERLALKSGFLRELLKAIEDLNHKYYDETFSAYGCNVAQVEVVINGKIAISEKYGVR